jgi:hypothetical protein
MEIKLVAESEVDPEYWPIACFNPECIRSGVLWVDAFGIHLCERCAKALSEALWEVL